MGFDDKKYRILCSRKGSNTAASIKVLWSYEVTVLMLSLAGKTYSARAQSQSLPKFKFLHISCMLCPTQMRIGMTYNPRRFGRRYIFTAGIIELAARICGASKHVPHATTACPRNQLNIANQSLLVMILVKTTNLNPRRAQDLQECTQAIAVVNRMLRDTIAKFCL